MELNTFLGNETHHNRFHCQEIPSTLILRSHVLFCVLYPIFPNNNSVTRLIQFILLLWACLKKINHCQDCEIPFSCQSSNYCEKHNSTQKVFTIYREKILEAALGSICIFQTPNPYCLWITFLPLLCIKGLLGHDCLQMLFSNFYPKLHIFVLYKFLQAIIMFSLSFHISNLSKSLLMNISGFFLV